MPLPARRGIRLPLVVPTDTRCPAADLWVKINQSPEGRQITPNLSRLPALDFSPYENPALKRWATLFRRSAALVYDRRYRHLGYIPSIRSDRVRLLSSSTASYILS